MAISGGDGSIILTTKVDETGFKKGLGSMKKIGATASKAFLAIGAAAATATVAITKMAVSAYADYEQLVGGVETLFKGSAQKVIDYANDAFYTAGKSANEYLDLTITFANSLIQGLGGDTERAADLANMAIVDMSDNVNRLGSDVQMVEYAYRGLARQEYRMLDNLKLGYQGTAAEMARLINDSKVMGEGFVATAENVRSISFDKYIEAIHEIQVQLGIAGTTSYEATATIQGSAKMMKAAWQNVLSAIAGGGDLDRAINNLVYSIEKFTANIVPVIEKTLLGLGQAIQKTLPMLVQTVVSALIQQIPNLVIAVYNMIVGLFKGIVSGIKKLFTGETANATEVMKGNVSGISSDASSAADNMNDVADATKKAGKEAKKSLAAFDELKFISSDTTTSSTQSTPEVSVGEIGGGVGVDTSALSETESEINGFSSIMQEQFAKILEIAKKLWDSTPVQSFVKATKTILGTLWNFATTMWGDIKNNSIMTWKNIEEDFKTIGKNLVKLWTSYWNDVNNAVKIWGQPIINSISELFNSIWESAIDPYIQITTKAWADFTGILVELWEKYGSVLLNDIGEFVHNIVNLFKSIYNNILRPIITPFLETLSSLWDKHISGMIEKAGELVMKLVNGALEIYNKFVHPIFMWLSETLEPLFTWIGNVISGVFYTIISTVSDVLSGVFQALGGLIDFIVGVFTGNWKKAWDGIKNYFIGIWNTIWGWIKFIINLIIDGLNLLWNGLYQSLATVINGVGGIIEGIGDLLGKDWGWKIPSNPPLIPKLAQGAVLPPNKPFLALVGDQKHGTNIEAPLDTIVEAMNIALSNNPNSNGNVIIEATGDVDSIISFFNFKIKQQNKLAGDMI